MAQPSVACYFNTRKRSAAEELNIHKAKKVLYEDSEKEPLTKSIKTPNKTHSNNVPQRKLGTPRHKIKKAAQLQPNIKSLLVAASKQNEQVEKQESIVKQEILTPTTPVKNHNAMDKIKLNEPTLSELKSRLSRSDKLAELKASINRFKQSASSLKQAERKTAEIKHSPTLKSFKQLELEVNISPQKVQSPEKPYLSPKKDLTVRRNLFNTSNLATNAVSVLSFSPKKTTTESSKPALSLPFKYRYLAEMFRAVDTVCQILFNRKEIISFSKLKPAVEEMLKRNLTEKHLAQIKNLFPESFELSREKLRIFGTGTRQQHWELVFVPQSEDGAITSELLLARRRKFFKLLIDKVKEYHQEFLASLDPPMEIPKEKITRWHPLFDLERVPDICEALLPQPPQEEKLTTGQEVLEKARSMFSCNTRMERALENLKEFQQKRESNKAESGTAPVPTSVLKGIPQALLEKVRQRQAAKALQSMTRTSDKDKQIEMYNRLPDIARFTRNLFVAEKKSVLPLEVVIDKLTNSYRTFLSRAHMEVHLKALSKEAPDWLVFHDIRNCVFVKINKNADLGLLVQKLEAAIKRQMDS